MNTTQSQNSTETAGGHTPGPWRVAPTSDYCSDINVDANNVYICKVGVEGDTVAEADARLIAQCPSLLAIVQRWMNWTQNGVQPIAVRIQLEADTKAVLAKLHN